jgi:hypothetical protein
MAALGEGSSGMPDATTLQGIVLPSTHDGQRAPGLRFGEPRAMALLASVASFKHVIAGLDNRGLRAHMAELYDPAYGSHQATYDLRRLRLKGLICPVPGTHNYRVTALGRAIATFFTNLAARAVVPVLTQLARVTTPPKTAPLGAGRCLARLRPPPTPACQPPGPSCLRPPGHGAAHHTPRR